MPAGVPEAEQLALPSLQAPNYDVPNLLDSINVLIEKSAALAKWSADAVRALAARPERVETINTQHRAIVEAIANHDATGGLQLLKLHLRPLSEITSVLPDED